MLRRENLFLFNFIIKGNFKRLKRYEYSKNYNSQYTYIFILNFSNDLSSQKSIFMGFYIS